MTFQRWNCWIIFLCLLISKWADFFANVRLSYVLESVRKRVHIWKNKDTYSSKKPYSMRMICHDHNLRFLLIILRTKCNVFFRLQKFYNWFASDQVNNIIIDIPFKKQTLLRGFGERWNFEILLVRGYNRYKLLVQ